ncbi:toll/interleukin-1 receptor domain-containing protein [Auraticoccus monumenti]|uniref:TIR domain-containing protein n=1 Tax=Auraticoccus monumenti TaxID=675864 RepID=A0A1G7D2C2_9ACTN|nr:toll/interleukin-1 receptor domain-containing protein [Auraticoccus monumenti]SDE45679.1 TIR domain-containing protein [Auraticoccus monumenti]
MAPGDYPKSVFISWSGEPSRRVARALHEAIHLVFDRIDPWMSDRDIAAGSRGAEEIHNGLNGAVAGVLIVTPENQDRPWLNYEAGALGRQVTDVDTRVVPVLVGFTSAADLRGPLATYQAVKGDRSGFLRVFTLLCLLGGIGEGRAEVKLDAAWAVLEAALGDAEATLAETTEPAPQERDEDTRKTDEMLLLLRGISHRVDRLERRGVPAESASANLERAVSRQLDADAERARLRDSIALTEDLINGIQNNLEIDHNLSAAERARQERAAANMMTALDLDKRRLNELSHGRRRVADRP